MKTILSIAVMILLSLNCLSQESNNNRTLDSLLQRSQQRRIDKEFEETVLNSITRDSAYISFEVESNNYSGKILIQNKVLFGFLQATKDFNKEQYKSFMKDVLSNKRTLKLEKIDSEFIKIKPVEAVEKIAAKGEGEFVNHYFTKWGAMIKGLSEEEKNAVIAKLFDWKIPTVIDDETGALIIF